MKLVIIVGNSAVGKMTVGEELAKLTNYKLFHNHVVIEPVLDVFGFFHREAIIELREVFYKHLLKSEIDGLILTFMLAFNLEKDVLYVDNVIKMFEKENAEVYFVELVASLETILERNKTENRLNKKNSKRDILSSEKRLLDDNSKYRFESYEGEVKYQRYLKINNDNLEAKEVALMIKNFLQT